MYVPPAFAVNDPKTCVDFAQAHSFATLVSAGEDGPFATHLPLLVDQDAAGAVTIIGHMARANPHWQIADGKPVLAIFSGPHAYVSASVYQAENVVPTWNYAVVHAAGNLKTIHDAESIVAILQRTVALYEQPRAQPWQFNADSAYSRNLTNAVVGFQISVTRLTGKYKLSQNQSAERQEKVMADLAGSELHYVREIFSMMNAHRAEM